MKKGFSLIELMVAVTIISIMVSIGVSAYGRGKERQSGKAAGDIIMTFLSDNQKKANIGKRDCIGKYMGQKVTFSAPNILQAQSLCSTSNQNPLPSPTVIPDITGLSNTSVTFKPLSAGIDLGASTSLDITYTSVASKVYTVRINNTGTFEYLGTP